MKKDRTTCVLPGTFDPITRGHMDMIERAQRLFDNVIVLFLTNPQKHCMFTLEQRMEMAKKALNGMNGVHIEEFEGLLANYCAQNAVNVVIRGLRNSSDFDYEMLYYTANHSVMPNIEMLFLPTKTEHLHISSSLTREIIKYHGDVTKFVPAVIVDDIKKHSQV